MDAIIFFVQMRKVKYREYFPKIIQVKKLEFNTPFAETPVVIV